MSDSNIRDQQREELARRRPGWEVWCVPLYVGGEVWCARPQGCDDPDQVLNADSPEHLDEAIAEKEADQLGGTPAAHEHQAIQQEETGGQQHSSGGFMP
jgi:hypothetical protein